MLESENNRLKEVKVKRDYFRVEDIQHNDKLVRFYTGFTSYAIFLAFFEFLGPVVDNRIYWGERRVFASDIVSAKLSPMNQLSLHR